MIAPYEESLYKQFLASEPSPDDFECEDDFEIAIESHWNDFEEARWRLADELRDRMGER